MSLKLTDLKPAAYNPRKISEKALAGLKKSLGEFGDISGFVWNKSTGNLVAGHQRLQALQQQYGDKLTIKGDAIIAPGNQRFPVRVVDWPVDKEKLANIAANNPLIAGEFTDGLEPLIASIKDLDCSALLDPLQITALLAAQPRAMTDGQCDPDDIPAQPDAAVTRPGDIWLLGNHRLMCGDSTNAEHMARLMGRECATLVFTDPPYGVSVGKKNRLLKSVQKAGRCLRDIADDDMSPDQLKVQLLAAFKAIYPFLADDCAVFVCSPQGGGLGMMMMMMMMMMQEACLIARHIIIWKKNSPTFSIGRLDYDYQHEPILFGWKKTHKRKKEGAFQTSVWSVDKPRASPDHPTSKPVALPENAILNHTDAGDIVLDMYLGSGTTMIASEQTDRRCFGMEIIPAYVDVCVARWQAFTGKPAILKRTGKSPIPMAKPIDAKSKKK